MTADPRQGLLVTPDLRRRLQQHYEQALRLAGESRPDFRRIHDLLAECVRADPGNILYLDALLANLRLRGPDSQARAWWQRWLAPWRDESREHPGQKRMASARAATAGTSYTVLSTAPEQLWSHFNDPAVLRSLAEAAEACDFEEVELRYLRAARDAAPDDLETLRLLARALTRQGRFEDAFGPWFAVLALAPSDAEAAQAVEDLRDSGEIGLAEENLANAQAAAGADLSLLHKREELRLRKSEQHLEIVRRRAASDPHPKAQALVSRMEQEHNRLEIDILNMRAERLPQAADVRLQLARRLKRAGNFSGAILRLEEAVALETNNAAVLNELGECWQHLRQFVKALAYYERAVIEARSISGDTEMLKLARYRAGILAQSLGKIDQARHYLEAVVASDVTFKDARQRLDNLGSS